jgi:hypothetical protein
VRANEVVEGGRDVEGQLHEPDAHSGNPLAVTVIVRVANPSNLTIYDE